MSARRHPTNKRLIAYNAQILHCRFKQRHTEAVIPSVTGCTVPYPLDRGACKLRDVIERCCAA